jgi:hypothetical protein
MLVARLSRLVAIGALALFVGCQRPAPSGPVRTADDAADVAERALRAADLDEQIVSTDRQGGAWIVTSRRPETSLVGHLVTVDAASGRITMERYRTLQLVGPP